MLDKTFDFTDDGWLLAQILISKQLSELLGEMGDLSEIKDFNPLERSFKVISEAYPQFSLLRDIYSKISTNESLTNTINNVYTGGIIQHVLNQVNASYESKQSSLTQQYVQFYKEKNLKRKKEARYLLEKIIGRSLHFDRNAFEGFVKHTSWPLNGTLYQAIKVGEETETLAERLNHAYTQLKGEYAYRTNKRFNPDINNHTEQIKGDQGHRYLVELVLNQQHSNDDDVKLMERVSFYDKFHLLLNREPNIHRSLNILSDRDENNLYSSLPLLDMIQGIERGKNLTTIMTERKDSFTPLETAFISYGEQNNKLELATKIIRDSFYDLFTIKRLGNF